MSKLTTQLRLFVQAAPLEIVERLVRACESCHDWNSLSQSILDSLHSKQLRQQFVAIVQEGMNLGYTPRELALALNTGKELAETYKSQQRLELVWTGPAISPFTLRRTDEVLLQMISEARESLIIVSFAIYKVERIFGALKAALERDVNIRFFLETDSEKIDGGSGGLKRDLPQGISIYTWSDKARHRTAVGQYGSLHAKLAIADNSALLVSSANFTEHAMSLNIELGLLITGGDLPLKTNQLFQDLITQKIFIGL